MSRSLAKTSQCQGRVRGPCVPGEEYFDKRHNLHCEEGCDSQAEMGGAVPMVRTRKHHQTSPLCLESSQKMKKTLPIKWRWPHQKMKTTSPKNEDDLTQKMKTTLPKKWRRPHPKKHEIEQKRQKKTIFWQKWQFFVIFSLKMH